MLSPTLVVIVVLIVSLKAVILWLEPRMAFFPIRGVQQTPGAAGLAYADVAIATPDGETLHGWWLDHPDPQAQVVFWHGNGGNLSLWLPVIVELRRRGFSVLAVDYRGYGGSTGSPSERGIYRDAEAAVHEFARSFRRDGVPVIYWGRSLGSPVASSTISAVRPDALVLESPMPHVRSVLRDNPILWVLSFLSSYRFPTSAFLQDYKGSLLVIHGELDSIVPFRAGQQVFANAGTTRKTFVSIPGADHNDLHMVNPGLYWGAIDEFVADVRASPD